VRFKRAPFAAKTPHSPFQGSVRLAEQVGAGMTWQRPTPAPAIAALTYRPAYPAMKSAPAGYAVTTDRTESDHRPSTLTAIYAWKGNNMTEHPKATDHACDCDWHLDQYWFECTCHVFRQRIADERAMFEAEAIHTNALHLNEGEK